MDKQKNLKYKWEKILVFLEKKFNDGQDLDIEGIIYLIGLQEFGIVDSKFRKDQKIDLMHIAICRLLEPFGYYQFSHTDEDGWPHYKTLTKLPNLKSGEQILLMKEAIVNYFLEKQLIQ
jgi:hypothetical protein|tara:strand:- start:2157 stop:2513 length:357 start_codon:yes stop_codon:yes gene_type:complete